MDTLIKELKEKIVAHLNLQDVAPDSIDADAPLFGDGLGLDSIDALELIVLLQQDYGIKITNAEEGRAVFRTVRTMAEYITNNKKN